jgi:organic radical activating enzyme
MTWEKSLVAIRSLRSEHHATHIEPQVIEVNWNLGKRCNYDCSYCGPAIHDWTSPHLSLDVIQDAVTQINDWVETQNKKFFMSLTGGEPYIHPDILEILQIIKNSSAYGEQLPVITNGSVPLTLYEKSLEFVTHLTISLHLERSDAETQLTLDKIIELHKKYPHRWINVQVMCLPGKFDFVENHVVPLLESNQVKFVLRRIRPWLNEVVDEWKNVSKREILKTKYSIEYLTEIKDAEKRRLDQRLQQVYESEDYYTNAELAWFQQRVPKTTWQNIGVWNTDMQYFETNSDLMVSNNRNRFKDWTCFIGIDSLFIDFDGLIYRGVCHNDGPIGKLGGKINFLNQPTICKKQWCTSNVDQTVRKSRADSLHFITQQ